MKIRNDYYSIACNDLEYLQAVLHLPFYNKMASDSQQIVEKLLKSVAELCSVDKTVLNSHNLRKINQEIKNCGIDLGLKAKDLAMLTDYYFDARYPGDDFVVVTKEECAECVDIVNQVFAAVNSFRKEKGLEVEQIPSRGIEPPAE